MARTNVTTIATTLAATLWLGLGVVATAHARVDVHVGIGIPAPPVVVFESVPAVEIVPGTQVYYMANPDYDLYRYGGYYYVNRDGYWYRARSYRGPFGPVEYGHVPRPIVVLPGSFHHYPVHPSNWHGGSPHHHAAAHYSHAHNAATVAHHPPPPHHGSAHHQHGQHNAHD